MRVNRRDRRGGRSGPKASLRRYLGAGTTDTVEMSLMKPQKMRAVVPAALLLVVAACTPSATRVDLTPVTPTPTNEYHPGQFVWYDLVTDDVTSAKNFYGELFGWQFEDVQGDDIVYSVVSHRGVAIAGIVPIDDGDVNVASSRWLSLMSVEDVDEAANAIERAGGSIDFGPTDNPTRGRLALVTDPEGATVVFLRARDGDPPNRDASELVSGRWMWTELWARDAVAAARLYQSVAGYQIETTDVAQSADYRVLTRDGRPRAGVNQLPWPEVQPNWLPYIKVDDPSAVARRVEQLGGTVLIPPLPEIRNGSVGLVMDPSGAAFAIQRWPIDGSPETPGGVGGAR